MPTLRMPTLAQILTANTIHLETLTSTRVEFTPTTHVN